MKIGRFSGLLVLFSAIVPSSGSANLANERPSVETVSERYLGRPYLLGNLGEGLDGRYDRDPLFRVDAFDCQTFVETVLAETISRNSGDLLRAMNSIRYRDGRIGYFDRNHFPEVDWIPNNAAAGLLQEITAEVAPDTLRAIRIYIDRAGWVEAHGADAIQIPGLPAAEKRRRLEELKAEGSAMRGEWANIPYVASADLLDFNVRDRIPSGAILSVVRENWFPPGGGTQMAISHMGFAIWKEGVLYYRNASSTEKAVVDIRLTDYVKKILHSETVRGFNIQKFVGVSR